MLMLGFISQDKALVEGVLEQMEQVPDWQLATFESPVVAMEVWQDRMPPLILLDVEHCNAQEFFRFNYFINDTKDRPWLLTIGDLPVASGVTEIIDNLARPLRLGKLMARLQFYKRRLQQPENKVYLLGAFTFYPRQHKLIYNQEELKLTDKETALLEYLACADQPVARERLLEDIWGYGPSVDTHTLETHIYRLRQKLMVGNHDGEDCFVSSQGRYIMNQAWMVL